MRRVKVLERKPADDAPVPAVAPAAGARPRRPRYGSVVAPQPAHPGLTLQQSVGNRTVSRLVQRDATADAATRDDSATPTGSGPPARRPRDTATFSDLGTVVIVAAQFTARRGARGQSAGGAAAGSAGEGSAPSRRTVSDIVLTVTGAEHLPELLQASATNRRFAEVVVRLGAVTVQLTAVYVTAVSVGDGSGRPQAQVVLTAARID